MARKGAGFKVSLYVRDWWTTTYALAKEKLAEYLYKE
jgi:hypothetical protein